jgi:hypothetical protein
VVDLSSDEEDFFPDTSWDEEFTRKLFGDLNCELNGRFGDGKIIILSGSNEEEEVCKEEATDAEAASPSAMNSTAPTVSVTDADNAPDEVLDDSNGGRTLDPAQDDSNDGGDEVGEP